MRTVSAAREGERGGSTAKIRRLIFEFLPLFHRRFSPFFHDNGTHRCTKNQNKALFILKQRGSMNPSTLGACLDMRQGSLTSLADGLITMGLVVREDDTVDRRKHLLSLTVEGKRYVEDRVRCIEAHIETLFASAGEEEAERFADRLEELVELMRSLQSDKENS